MPWNQRTFVGFLAEVAVIFAFSVAILINYGVFILLFVSICIHHQAFYKMFKHLAQNLGSRNAGNSSKELLSRIIRLHVTAHGSAIFICSEIIIRSLFFILIINNEWIESIWITNHRMVLIFYVLITDGLWRHPRCLSPYIMVHIISHMLFMSIDVFQLDLVMHFFFTDQTYARIHRTIFSPVFGQILIFFIVCFILDLEPISYTVSREKFLKICFIKKIIEKFLRFFWEFFHVSPYGIGVWGIHFWLTW